MIRFALKSAFALGIASLFVPGLGSSDKDGAGIDLVKSFVGFQAAVEDVLGFCTRAPEACKAGSELSTFALGQMETGIGLAIDAAGPALVSSAPKPGLDTTPAPGEPHALRLAPVPDWGAIDPALLAELQAFGQAAEEAGAGEVSPEMLAAVRRAAKLATKGEIPVAPPAAPLSPRFGQEAVAATQPAGAAAVPVPRSRPGL
ncbi:DUF5330 domain-containing protein [Fulvimarina sp. 2208YS6-2-32]|uniref:DUF5330 domain-containing protein n=1 Tax=Fulvimarina uroteuthidis TaxID=3098149 RepID=A0ABU5I3M7_9HYPH|nr:DUF5330 domain-containing protein [Fulvimarina sp. 2208YS6-2-32]MDY8109980.1 DUF5330 domain-containing protein [Fulvimarina sp. 2208YS6-2-32]